jgi:hypothetical protein
MEVNDQLHAPAALPNSNVTYVKKLLIFVFKFEAEPKIFVCGSERRIA